LDPTGNRNQSSGQERSPKNVELPACGGTFECLVGLAGSENSRGVRRLAVHALMLREEADSRTCSALERLLSDKAVRRLIRLGLMGRCGFSFAEHLTGSSEIETLPPLEQLNTDALAKILSDPEIGEHLRLAALAQLYSKGGWDRESFRFALRIANDASSPWRADGLTLALTLAERMSEDEQVQAEDVLYSCLSASGPVLWCTISDATILLPSPRVIRRLEELMESGDLELEVAAARILFRLGKEQPRVIRTLLDALGDEREGGTAQMISRRSLLFLELASPLPQARANAAWISARANSKGSLYDIPYDFWALLLVEPYRAAIAEAMSRNRQLESNGLPTHPYAREVWPIAFGQSSMANDLTTLGSQLDGPVPDARRALLSIAALGANGSGALDKVVKAARHPELTGLAIAVLSRIGHHSARRRALDELRELAASPLCNSVVPHLGAVLHALGTEQERLWYLRSSVPCVQLVGLYGELLEEH
jgi:hypothetical protein